MDKQPKVVAIGGGTGLAVLLKGLKRYTSQLTAIVTVGDDGGSSGNIRENMGILPPGDIRNCINALANTEPMMQQMMEYRFKDGDLNGHSLGNLIIAAMTDVYGGFDEAIRHVSSFLAVTGQVLPVTLDDMVLYGEFENGEVIKGESKIPRYRLETGSRIKRVFIQPEYCEPLSDALEAIEAADVIVLGPGSLYTSLIPNLLVKDMGKAVAESKAIKVYVLNIMTQPGETGGYNFEEHISEVFKHCSELKLDYVLVNNEKIPEDILTKYKRDGADPIYYENEDLSVYGLKALPRNLLRIDNEYVRHDYITLAEVIIGLCGR